MAAYGEFLCNNNSIKGIEACALVGPLIDVFTSEARERLDGRHVRPFCPNRDVCVVLSLHHYQKSSPCATTLERGLQHNEQGLGLWQAGGIEPLGALTVDR